MKKTALIVLALILGALLLLSTACSKPENGKENETTLAPDTQAAPDSGTEKEEETALPDDATAEDTDSEAEPVPDDTRADVPHEDDPEQSVKSEEELLQQIAEDYFYKSWCRSPGTEGYNTYYIKKYYGNYDGVVPVTIEIVGREPYEWDHEELIAGYSFPYSEYGSIYVWKDGEFYSLTSAYYNLGMLTKKQIGEINAVIPVEYGETEYFYPSPDVTIVEHPAPSVDELVAPDPPADGLLDQIAKDYCYNNLMLYAREIKSLDSFYVRDYYGTYDGAVAVMIYGGGDYPDVITEEIIAGYRFVYPNGNTMEIWKDGAFYTLLQAYRKGILTEDQIGQIRRTVAIRYESTEHCYPRSSDTVDESYVRAVSGVHITGDALRKELNELLGGDLVWLERDMLENKEFYSICSYGSYNNCTVLFTWGDAEVEVTVNIADSEFYYPRTMNLYGYYDGVLYSLEEAYEKGFISAEFIERAAKNHRAVQEYLNYN